ncbi:MAG TPA: glycosyltransferase family 9 protein [Candidatus Acidoferrales bacterium]|nr:glycosyltransferase family 9 protein [Candidatus Acidoferrales bacterium]
MIASLRECEPRGTIDVVVMRQGPAELFSGLQHHVNRVIHLRYWEHGLRRFLCDAISARSARPYDAAFLSFPAARPAYRMLMALFAADRRYAHDWGFWFDRYLSVRSVRVRDVHNVERNMDLLRAAGIAGDTIDRYLTPDAWRSGDRDSTRVVVHVGSVKHDGLAAKRWPLEKFATLCAELRESGFAVTLLSGPDEYEETAACARAAGDIPIFQAGLAETARFLSSSGAVVANDNGIAHLAAGLGTPAIAIFGPTPLTFAPWAPDARALRPSPCPPCFDVRKPEVHCVRNIDFACLKGDLPVSLVLDAVRVAVSADRANLSSR